MKWRDFLYLLPLPFVAISYCLIPITNDMRIFQGVARLTDYFGYFPMSVDRAWEIKPIGNRMMEYLIYKLVTLFTPFGSPFYSPYVKLVSVFLVFACCYYFATRFKGNEIPMFALTSLSFLTVMNFLALQAEWFASLFALLALGLLITKWDHTPQSIYTDYLRVFLSPPYYPDYLRLFLCGVVMLFLFNLKGITVLLVVPVFCAAYLLDEDFQQKAPIAFFSFLFSGFVFFLLCLTLFPYSIKDMAMAARLARVGQYSLITYANTMTEKFIGLYPYLPAFFYGAIIGLLQLATIRLPRPKYLVLILMWLFPLAIVFSMGEFYMYHFAVLIFPAIVSVALCVRDPPAWAKLDTLFPFCIASMVVLWLIFTSTFGAITVIENEIWYTENQHAAEANALFDIKAQPSTLFLDTGTGAYFFHTNSSCRYSGVLPVQRHTSKWNISDLSAYAELYSCIMAYDGKYIVGLDWWFARDVPERAPIYEKIDREYTLVYNGSWDIYQKKVNTVN